MSKNIWIIATFIFAITTGGLIAFSVVNAGRYEDIKTKLRDSLELAQTARDRIIELSKIIDETERRTSELQRINSELRTAIENLESENKRIRETIESVTNINTELSETNSGIIEYNQRIREILESSIKILQD